MPASSFTRLDRSMRTLFFLIAALVLPGALQLSATAAEEFILEGGGRISGEVLNPAQIPRTDYIVRTDAGVVFKIDRSQVAKKEYHRPEEVEYERIWPRFADTVEDQWKLAEWCRENRLTEQREYHLNRILQLDPDHADARRILGFRRQGGRWTTREDEYRKRGYVQFEGEWRTPQEVQLIEEDRRIAEAQTEWLKKVKTYRDQLASGNGAAQAQQALLSLSDPNAIKALGKALVDESDPRVRELYLDALGHLGTDQATMLLAVAFMKEPVEELRYTCLDHLKGKHLAVEYFVNLLGDKDNSVVNQAASALGNLEDPSAIGPLIRSLVTFHKHRIKKSNPGQTSASFGSGGTGFSAGGSDMIVSLPEQNRAVLDALVKLTGQSYGFNIDQWKVWHANQRRYEHVNARRD